MAEAFYPPMPATDGTFSPVPGGVFEVFELTDTERVTPLPLRVGDGNSSTTVKASDTLAVVPGTYVTSPNVSHNWVSGQFIWRRDSFDRAELATEEARAAAVAAANDAGVSAQAAVNAAGLVDAPAGEAVRAAVAPGGAASAELNMTYATKESPAFSGVPTGITKEHVGLGAVENMSIVDAVEPKLDKTEAANVYATQTALDGKANKSHVINPMSPEYGLAGNGTTNDGPALQALINSLPNYYILEFPKNTVVSIQTTVSLNKPITILGGYFKAHATDVTFNITSDNVTIEDNYFDGPGTTDGPLTTNKFITTNGVAGSPRRNLRIIGNTMRGTRYSFMWLHWLTDFEIARNDIQQFQYTGITVLSPKNGVINFNTIRFAIQGGSLVNSYGIAVTDETNDEAGRAENVRVIGNFITDILKWEAIDTHGGKGIHILGNTMINVRQGPSLMTGNTSRIYPPYMCVVANNYIVRGTADDTAWGICLAGRSGDSEQTVGPELASATIMNNSVIGYTNDISLGRYDITLTHLSGNVSTSTGAGRRGPSHPPFRVYSDRVTIALNGNNSQTVQMVFPTSHFTLAPSVQITKQSGAGAAYIPFVSTVDADQVTVGIYSATPASTGTVALSVECKQANTRSAYGNNRA